MIRVRDRSTVMASDSVRLMKLLRSLYSVSYGNFRIRVAVRP